MSSLKDIMDVDVEPLQSQAYRKEKEAVQHRPVDKSSLAPPLSLDNQEEMSTRRHRPNSGPNTASQPIQQHNNSVGEPMNFHTAFQTGSSDQASTPGSTHQSSPRASESTLDLPVKYTPVTHRVSKAKKGVRIHTCDSCPKTFTRAEHLRRHQLSHNDPAFPCTIRGCEKAFHRPDLLARHLQRHENEDEKPDISGGAESSPASSGSDPSNSPTPILKSTTAVRGSSSSNTNQSSFVDPTTPTSGAVERSPIYFGTGANSFQAHISDTGSSTLPPTTGPNIANQDCYPEHVRYGLSELPNFATTHIPEELHMPGLSYTKENSPLCSSESDSTYSTQSDASQPSRQRSRRPRSSSLKNVPGWSSAAPQFHSNVAVSMSQDLRGPQFDSVLGQFESYASPRMTPPGVSNTLLDAPISFERFSVEPMETPALSMYSKPMASAFSTPTPQVSDFRLGSVDVKLKPLMEQHLEALRICETMTHLTPLNEYISSYWQSFHPLSPMIHRGTFDPTENILLSSAMAAIGTQYHNTAAARQKGAELNEYCKKSIDLLLNWDLHTMQAIMLTEIFTRYRGRKTNIKLSRQFEELYSRLLRNSTQDQTVLPGQDLLYAVSGSSLNHDITDPTAQHLQHSDTQSEWLGWIDIETRKRLLAVCFMFDTHVSLFHEQNRSNVHHPDITSLLYLPCPDNIWNATSALDWQAQYGSHVSQPLQLFERGLKSIANRSTFIYGLVMSLLVSRLPPRDDPKYPNKVAHGGVPLAISRLRDIFPTAPGTHISIALYNTPLHDLLAIAGDTWVFGKKLTPPSAFRTAQSNLKTWSSSLNAATATLHACHVLSTLLPQPTQPHTCISGYWAYYISALICWAFGSRHHSSSSSSHPPSSSTSSPSSQPLPRAQKYISSILSLSAEDLLTSKAYMRGDTDGLIDAVRAHLEIDAVGSRCMMLVDAVHVLTQLKECSGKGGGKSWFR